MSNAVHVPFSHHVFQFCSVISVVPNISVLRSFKVLRPLRSVSKLPGLKKIIGALMESTRDLANVMFLLAFLVTCFSITGMFFWRGLLHARCRLTPFPVVLSSLCENASDSCWDEYIQNVSSMPDNYRCLPNANDDPTWTRSSSPWYTEGPQDCIWPTDDNDERICSLGESGNHLCAPLYEEGRILNRTCGSNYDAFGNSRFIESTRPYGYSRMKSGTFIAALNWGFTHYDSFLPAFLTTFQVITLEGWTDIMYQVIDAWSFAPTVAIFCIQVILCGYIVLNLVLAVITKSLDNFDNDDAMAFTARSFNLKVIREGDEISEEEDEECLTFEGNDKSASSMEAIMSSWHHSAFIMICIILNTIVLSLDHYGIAEDTAGLLENFNTVFTIIFIVDVLLCNMAFGVKAYWR